MTDSRYPRRHRQYAPTKLWATITQDEKERVQAMAQATADAPTEETTVDGEVVQILSDENVGSHLVRASTETWRTAVANLHAGDKGGQKIAETLTSMLRAANQEPNPGQMIEIELQGGTESDVVLDAIVSNIPPEIEPEYGNYNRKAQTSRKTATTGKANGATRKSKKGTPKECACGCGDMTGGGTFRPGHDARHKGNLLRRIDEGGEDGQAALEELRKYPNLTDLDAAAARLGSGPAKKAAQAERLAKLKAEKAAAAESDDEDEDEEEGEEAES